MQFIQTKKTGGLRLVWLSSVNCSHSYGFLFFYQLDDTPRVAADVLVEIC
jgi:hypothetical protein